MYLLRLENLDDNYTYTFEVTAATYTGNTDLYLFDSDPIINEVSPQNLIAYSSGVLLSIEINQTLGTSGIIYLVITTDNEASVGTFTLEITRG